MKLILLAFLFQTQSYISEPWLNSINQQISENKKEEAYNRLVSKHTDQGVVKDSLYYVSVYTRAWLEKKLNKPSKSVYSLHQLIDQAPSNYFQLRTGSYILLANIAYSRNNLNEFKEYTDLAYNIAHENNYKYGESWAVRNYFEYAQLMEIEKDNLTLFATELKKYVTPGIKDIHYLRYQYILARVEGKTDPEAALNRLLTIQGVAENTSSEYILAIQYERVRHLLIQKKYYAAELVLYEILSNPQTLEDNNHIVICLSRLIVLYVHQNKTNDAKTAWFTLLDYTTSLNIEAMKRFIDAERAIKGEESINVDPIMDHLAIKSSITPSHISTAVILLVLGGVIVHWIASKTKPIPSRNERYLQYLRDLNNIDGSPL